MWNDNASLIDLLFYDPYANVVLDIIKETKNNPITIGLFGSWGAGKSSMLNFVNNKIKSTDENAKICCIKIDAWLLEGYSDAKLGVVESVLEAIKENQTFFQGLKDNIFNIIKKVNWLKVAKIVGKTGISIGVSALSGNPIPALTSIASTALTEIGENSDELLKERDNNYQTIEKNVREIREDFEKLLKSSPIENLVVMVDDLDRCSPDVIIEVLEAIKLFLSVSKTTFIFAVDEAIIRYSINRKYAGDDKYSNDSVAKDYIEKIIQIPIVIPSLSSKDIENYLLLLYYQSEYSEIEFNSILSHIKDDKVLIGDFSIEPKYLDDFISKKGYKSSSNAAEFHRITSTICNVRKVVSGSLKGNPRQAKRFLNAFFIKRKLAGFYYDDIDDSVLAKIMALYLIDEEAFKELNKWNLKFNGTIPELEDIESYGKYNEYQKWNKESIKRWIDSEPRNIYKLDLRKYFYLTKEYLTDETIGGYTTEEREILSIISNGDAMVVDSYLKDLHSRNFSMDNIVNTIFDRFKNNKLDISIIVSLFDYFDQYREKIKELIKSTNLSTLKLGSVPSLKRFITIDCDMKTIISNNNTLNAHLRDMVV